MNHEEREEYGRRLGRRLSEASSRVFTSALRLWAVSRDISEEGLHQIIRIHRSLPNNNLRVSNYEFFHAACRNENVTEGIIRCLLEYFPDAVNADDDGRLPLLNGIAGPEGMPPFHYACMHNNVETVKYLYNLHPDAIDHEVDGYFPIHYALKSVTQRAANPEAAVDIVKFLLDCDPRVKFQRAGTLQSSGSPLALACSLEYNDTNIGAAVEMIGVVYDAHPEAIEHVRMIRHPQIRAFVKSQQFCSRLATTSDIMTAPDENGQLPLHKALVSNVRLGSIMLLHQGNPAALQSPDIFGALPLHVACTHHKSTRVVQYLIGRDPSTLEAVDHENNTPLHYACNGANYETIALLLGKYDAVSVSKRNAEGKLPIEVLWESIEGVDRESVEYTECVFQLLRAYPEITMNADLL